MTPHIIIIKPLNLKVIATDISYAKWMQSTNCAIQLARNDTRASQINEKRFAPNNKPVYTLKGLGAKSSFAE